jgi:hypothetical protein
MLEKNEKWITPGADDRCRLQRCVDGNIIHPRVQYPLQVGEFVSSLVVAVHTPLLVPSATIAAV